MGFATKIAFGGLALGAAVVYYVQKRHVATGESYVDIVKQLPSVARRTADDVRRRATHALEEGKAAARVRDEELARQLEAAPSPPGGTTYPGM